MARYLKNNQIVFVLILFMILLAMLFILPNGKQIIDMFSYLAAFYLFMLAISFLMTAIKYKQYLDVPNQQKQQQIMLLLEALFLLVLGALILIFPVYLVRIIIGITLLILPTINLFTKIDKWLFLKKNFWKYIVGIVFILAVEGMIDYVFLCLGIALLLFVCYIIYLLVINYKDLERPNIIIKYSIAYLNKKGKT